MNGYDPALEIFLWIKRQNENMVNKRKKAIHVQKHWNASRICVSSLRRGHANLLCIVPILVYVNGIDKDVVDCSNYIYSWQFHFSCAQRAPIVQILRVFPTKCSRHEAIAQGIVCRRTLLKSFRPSNHYK